MKSRHKDPKAGDTSRREVLRLPDFNADDRKNVAAARPPVAADAFNEETRTA